MPDNLKHTNHPQRRSGISISSKILGVTLGTTIVVLVVSGIISFIMSREAVENNLFAQLTSVREIKGQQIEDYVNSINLQIITLSESPSIVEAMYRFNAAFSLIEKQAENHEIHDVGMHSILFDYYKDEYFPRLRPNTPDRLGDVSPADFLPTSRGAAHLQSLYISENPHPTGMKQMLDKTDNSLYSRLHAKFHPILRSFLEKFGYNDIFLVDHETGHIVYSTFKAVDFATSLATGPYQDTNFARAFNAAAAATDKNFVKLVDFEPYYPSYNAPASFIASPIFDGDRKLGVLVFQMPIDRINNIMTSNQNWEDIGLGQSGETYIVGDDFTMRNQSRFLIEDSQNYFKSIRENGVDSETADIMERLNTSIGMQLVETRGTTAALKGDSGTGIYQDYRGVPVLSSYRPLLVSGVNWVIISEIDEAEAFAPVEKLKDRFLVVGILLAVIAIGVAFFFSRSLTIALKNLTHQAKSLTQGHLDEAVVIESSDEIGQLAYSFEDMRLSLRKLIEDLTEERDTLESRVSDRTVELNKALTKQKEQAGFQAALLDAVPNPIYVKDAAGRYSAFNRAYEEAYGMRREDYVGKTLAEADYLPEKKREEYNHAATILATSEGFSSEEDTVRFADGLDHDVLYLRSTFDLGDRISWGTMGVIIDITERKEMERQTDLARQQAEAANQAKSAFLANMSHELRTPMNAILGYSEMLTEEAEDLGQEEFVPDLKKINQAGTHLLSLINDVLDISKIEAGKMEAFPEDFDVNNLIDEVSTTVLPLMDKQGNRLAIERGKNLGIACQDSIKLRQALYNLLSNAAKFTEQGTVTLHAHRNQHQGEDWLTLAVSDTGIGIAEDKLEQVFEEFTQADGSTTRDYGGTGLGLSISRRFSRLLGGDLDVYSEVGEGSTFTIRIPARLAETEPQSTTVDPSTTKSMAEIVNQTSGSTILVIDDDPEACEIIQYYLVKDGFAVVTASSGEQGLRLAREIKPVAITLDVMMPEMDGWSVLRALKADPVLHKIPVVMLTMIDDRSRGYSLGAVDYLTKPVDREQLHKVLARYYREDESCAVLLVEDDVGTREIMARTLQNSGWSVSEASNGQEALELMPDLQPGLILLDLMMPVMDGFGFLAALRQNPQWQEIPVIVVTAKDLTEADRELLNGKAEEVLEKNAYTREQLLLRVREAVIACNVGPPTAAPSD